MGKQSKRRAGPWCRAGGWWWPRAWQPGRRISWLPAAAPWSHGRSLCSRLPSCAPSGWSAAAPAPARPPRRRRRRARRGHRGGRTGAWKRKGSRGSGPWRLLPVRTPWTPWAEEAGGRQRQSWSWGGDEVITEEWKGRLGLDPWASSGLKFRGSGFLGLLRWAYGAYTKWNNLVWAPKA